jgi:hypothetical protein
MPLMKNTSKRKFTIAGKTLAPDQELEFAESVVERHVRMYPELTRVQGGDVQEVIETPAATKEPLIGIEPMNKEFAKMTVAELKEHLDSLGKEIPENARKADLLALL